MSHENALACIRWADDHPARTSLRPAAYCEHDGCPWTSTAATEQAQLSAFINHHQLRHQEES